MTNAIEISAAATLTLQRGVQVQFRQDAGLQIDGGLVAIGSHAEMTLQIDYTAADLGSPDPQFLKLCGLDELEGTWSYVGIPSVPNIPNGRVDAQLQRLAPIRVTALDFARIWLPLLYS